jgi:hypothetical protein
VVNSAFFLNSPCFKLLHLPAALSPLTITTLPLSIEIQVQLEHHSCETLSRCNQFHIPQNATHLKV